MAETRIECPNRPCICDSPRLIGKNGRTYHALRTDQTAQGEGGKSKRVCPCESLPNVGLNYPCVMTVNGQHCYVDVRRVEGNRGE